MSKKLKGNKNRERETRERETRNNRERETRKNRERETRERENREREDGENREEMSECKTFSAKKWYKKDCEKLGQKKSIKEYRCKPFEYNENESKLIDNIDRLEAYIEKMNHYYTHLKRCADGRKKYYESCILNNPNYTHTQKIREQGRFTKENEEVGHKYAREKMEEFKDECAEMLFDWKKRYANTLKSYGAMRKNRDRLKNFYNKEIEFQKRISF